MRIIESDSQAKHLTEWLNSGVDEEIYHLNVRSLSGTLPYEYLLYSPKISRRNDGRLRDRDLANPLLIPLIQRLAVSPT